MRFVTHIGRHRKVAQNPGWFPQYLAKGSRSLLYRDYICFNILQSFIYIIENDIKDENIYNMDENIFIIRHNKHLHPIMCNISKNTCLVQYNFRELVTVIESICAVVSKLPTFIIIQRSSYRIGNLIHAEKEGKAPHTYSKNV